MKVFIFVSIIVLSMTIIMVAILLSSMKKFTTYGDEIPGTKPPCGTTKFANSNTEKQPSVRRQPARASKIPPDTAYGRYPMCGVSCPPGSFVGYQGKCKHVSAQRARFSRGLYQLTSSVSRNPGLPSSILSSPLYDSYESYFHSI